MNKDISTFIKKEYEKKCDAASGDLELDEPQVSSQEACTHAPRQARSCRSFFQVSAEREGDRRGVPRSGGVKLWGCVAQNRRSPTVLTAASHVQSATIPRCASCDVAGCALAGLSEPEPRSPWPRSVVEPRDKIVPPREGRQQPRDHFQGPTSEGIRREALSGARHARAARP